MQKIVKNIKFLQLKFNIYVKNHIKKNLYFLKYFHICKKYKTVFFEFEFFHIYVKNKKNKCH